MRIIVFALVIVFAAAGAPARAADDYLDCYKTVADDSSDKIAVCTRLINTGRWNGLNLARLFSNRALGYMKEDKLDQAMADLDRSLKISPNYVFGLDQRGEVWRLRGNYDKAIVDYNAAIRIDPTFVAAYLDRGNAFKATGNRKAARADFQAVLDMPGQNRAVDKWAKEQAQKQLDALGKDD